MRIDSYLAIFAKCHSLVSPVMVAIQTSNVLHSCQNVVKGLKTERQTSSEHL